jgi:Protein NO VEIN, C-terminal
MATDYDAISRENQAKYGTEVSNYGSDFAERYSNRTHFIFELLQNAEDALRWRGLAGSDFSRTIRFALFANRLEVRHFGIPFAEEHVRGICGIKRGTKNTDLNTIGEFGIGFKSVYAYTLHPEVHSGDEHFLIRDYVHPNAIVACQSPLQDDETLFVLPFDQPNIGATQAHEEIARKLRDLGLRTLLFLREIDAIAWHVEGGDQGSYSRATTALDESTKVVTLVGAASEVSASEDWLVFSRAVQKRKGAAVGHVEVAYQLRGRDDQRSVTRVEDSTLAVYFPTEKETHLGFLIQGPYKTTSSRDNVPSDDSWNQTLVIETAQLVVDSLQHLKGMKMLSISTLSALPLNIFHFAETSMFRPIYLRVVEALKTEELIPALDGRFGRAPDSRIPASKSLVELLPAVQLQNLLKSPTAVDWVTPDVLSDSRRDVLEFLKNTIGIPTLSISTLADKFDADFLLPQKDAWIARFYAFLIDFERLWRVEKPRGPLLEQPIIRLQDGSHVKPFRPDGSPAAYLPPDTETEFPTVRRILLKNRRAGEFLRKLKFSVPDIATEVLEKVLPQYTGDSPPSDRKHVSNLKKILKALAITGAKHQEVLRHRLVETPFLRAVRFSDGAFSWRRPGEVYFSTKEMEIYADGNDSMWFVGEAAELLARDNIHQTLAALGVEDKPRRVVVDVALSYDEQWELRGGSGYNAKTTNYGLDGLDAFLARIKAADFNEVCRLSRVLWGFLIAHVEAGPIRGRTFFRGVYEWHHYKDRGAVFDAHFLRVLRKARWLPDKSGTVHRPNELMPRDLPKGFAPHPALASELQMRAEVLVTLAKEAGIRVEDLDFLRGHRREWEQFKRAIKAHALQSPTGSATATLPGPGEHGQAEPLTSTAEENGRDRSGVSDGSNAQSGKFISYIYVTPEESEETRDNSIEDADASPNRSAVDEAGIRVVLDYERAEGRVPKQMAQTHPGFDILSSTAAGEVARYIEVKSISAEWSELGVTLSQPQFIAAQTLRDKFWLYVVARANSAEPRLIRIRNPAQLARSFTFDSGWEAVAENRPVEDDS